LTEAIDTMALGGKLVFFHVGALAEFKRSIIRERTKAGCPRPAPRVRLALSADDLVAARAQRMVAQHRCKGIAFNEDRCRCRLTGRALAASKNEAIRLIRNFGMPFPEEAREDFREFRTEDIWRVTGVDP